MDDLLKIGVISMDNTMNSLLNFVENCTKQGIYNKNTGESRKGTIKKFLSAIDDLGQMDVNNIDVDDLVKRYANKFPGINKSVSLTAYKSRLTKSIEDFKSFQESPTSFKPHKNHIKNKASTDSKSQSVKKPRYKESSQAATPKEEPGMLPSTTIEPAISLSVNPTMHLRLRPNIDVAISGLPIDLTETECQRITALINVFTISEHN
jgi:hypothetical protein